MELASTNTIPQPEKLKEPKAPKPPAWMKRVEKLKGRADKLPVTVQGKLLKQPRNPRYQIQKKQAALLFLKTANTYVNLKYTDMRKPEDINAEQMTTWARNRNSLDSLLTNRFGNAYTNAKTVFKVSPIYQTIARAFAPSLSNTYLQDMKRLLKR